MTPAPSGYADPAYAESLRELGTPRRLLRSGGSILVRSIPGTGHADAMGPYPVFACCEWSRLSEDLEALRDELVTLVVVTDPFGDWSLPQLEACFPDRCAPFKKHFVVDLSLPALQSASRHHRRDAARALRRTTVEIVGDSRAFLDEWDELYRGLMRRHDIRGPAAFSRASFVQQLGVRGLTAFRAERSGDLHGAALWFVDGPVAYYHLAAYSDTGYRAGVSYALVAAALEHFAGRGLEWAALGAGAGVEERPDVGLARFKAGWATGTRTAFLCGRVLDERRYAELVGRGVGEQTAAFFPAYRAPG